MLILPAVRVEVATVAHFDIAVQKKTSDRNAPPNYFPVTCWGRTADFAEKYLSKGRKVCVVGEPRAHGWIGQDKDAKAEIEMSADEVEFLSPKTSEDGGFDKPHHSGSPETDTSGFMDIQSDDIPF